MSKKVQIPARKIVELARAYFEDHFGLSLQEHIADCCAEFTGDIGFVTVQVVELNSHNEVVLTTREWEYQIQDFLSGL
jgi:hypothetical protein